MGGKGSGRRSTETMGMLLRIPLRAKLRTTIAELRQHASDYPSLKLIRSGSALTYLLLPEHEEAKYTMNLAPSSVVFELRSRATPIDNLRPALLKLLSTMAILGWRYSIELEDAYPYLLIALGSHNLNSLMEGVKKQNNSCNSDIILARRINSLLGQNTELSASERKLKHDIAEIIAQILIDESRLIPISERSLLDKYRISEATLRDAIKSAESRGYRCVRAGNNFYMVES